MSAYNYEGPNHCISGLVVNYACGQAEHFIAIAKLLCKSKGILSKQFNPFYSNIAYDLWAQSKGQIAALQLWLNVFHLVLAHFPSKDKMYC